MENKSLKFYKVGHQFLNSAIILLENLVQSKNKKFVISEYEITEDEYKENTKYSDFNIIIPVLFNYYHGLELIIKGALEQVGKLGRDRHDIISLSNRLKEEYKEDEKFANCIIEKIDNPIINISKFKEDNENIDAFSLYEALRYPDNPKGQLINYNSLIFNGENVILGYQEIVKNIKEIKINTVKKYRELQLINKRNNNK